MVHDRYKTPAHQAEGAGGAAETEIVPVATIKRDKPCASCNKVSTDRTLLGEQMSGTVRTVGLVLVGGEA